MCRNAQIAVLFVNSAPKSTSSARPVSGLNLAPTGCCMNEFAAMMKYAEALTPNATIQMHARCTSRGSRVHPKIHRPRNVDSKKNAIRALERQRCPEDVTDEPRVLAPVHPELEFLHDAGGHAQREIDQKELAEEPGQPVPGRVAGDDPCSLHGGDERSQSDSERDEYEVIDGGGSELPPRHIECVHLNLSRGCVTSLRQVVVEIGVG